MPINPDAKWFVNQQKYIKQYKKKTYKTITLQLRREEDKEIIEYLNDYKNKSEFLKEAILYYKENHKG